MFKQCSDWIIKPEPSPLQILSSPSKAKHNCHTTGVGLGRGGEKSRLKGPQEVGMENRKQMKQDFWDVYAQGEMLDIFSGKEK